VSALRHRLVSTRERPRRVVSAPHIDDHLIIFRALNKFQVEYLIFGNLTGLVYGEARSTGDLDIWINSAETNLAKFRAGLEGIGVHAPSPFPEELRLSARPVDAHLNFPFGRESFSACFSRRATAKVDGERVWLLAPEDRPRRGSKPSKL